MFQATERHGYTTYAPAGSRCVRCGFPIRESQLADRSMAASTPAESPKVQYRHTQFKDCKRA